MYLLIAIALIANPPVAADLVVTGGKFWTGDPTQPEARAVAIWQGRILKVGSQEEINALVGPNTKTIELRGQRVVPGFYDSHVHMLGGGAQLSRVELKDAKDEAEFGKRLKEFDAKTPRDRWMLGGNWDHDRTFNGTLPTATLLDKYVPNRPVFLQRYDGHMGVANTAALKLAGITAATKAPEGGVIFRTADGQTPSGVLKDNAMDLVDKIIPEPNEAELRDSLRAAIQEAARTGVTSVQDMDGSPPTVRKVYFRVLQQFARSGKLTCRVDLRWPIASHGQLENLAVEANYGNDFVRVGGLKGFMDGSLGSSTAKMAEPYLGGENTGVYVTRPNSMKAFVQSADRAGLSVAVHAIGDLANKELLDIFEAAIQANGPRDRRFRIEHAQHLRPADYPRFKQLGVVASMQPYHAIDDGRWAEGRIGAKRCASSYAYRSLLDNGAVLAFGSDWPVAPLNPLVGIDAAVNRRTLDGKDPNGWFPEQRITVAEAVRAYTYGSAYAAHQESERGTLAAGKLADLVVLSRDIFDEKERYQIGETKVLLTIVGGKVAFQK
jgi:predicted amidohydrolase YtcJ